jgi:hypothetical protein
MMGAPRRACRVEWQGVIAVKVNVGPVATSPESVA